MTLKRFLLLLVFGLFAYLGLYTWNERTAYLDSLAENTGLEFVGYVLSPVKAIDREVSAVWNRYVDLINVREENDILKARLANATATVAVMQEGKQELLRLRELMNFSPPEEWSPIGVRVVGTRVGPQAALNSLLLDKGFLTGATPGTPVVTHQGAVGRILRASPHFSTVVLLSDPSCRIAVITQETRFQGIIMGTGAGQPLEVHYVPPNAHVRIGEYLVTSGLDGVFPKGIPVAWVDSARPSDTSPFQAIKAWPLVQIDQIEEMLLLQPAAGRREVNFNRTRDRVPMPPESETLPDGTLRLLPPQGGERGVNKPLNPANPGTLNGEPGEALAPILERAADNASTQDAGRVNPAPAPNAE